MLCTFLNIASICVSLILFDNVVVLLILVEYGPVLRRIDIGLSILFEHPLLNQQFLPGGPGPQPPLPRIGLPIHDDSLGLRHHPVITGTDLRRRHLRNGHSNSLSLRGHDHDLAPEVYVAVVTQNSWDHELRAVADGVYGGVLDDDSWEAHEEDLKGEDYAAQVGFVLVVLVPPLGVQDVVHSHEVLVLGHRTRFCSAQFLHMASSAQ